MLAKLKNKLLGLAMLLACGSAFAEIDTAQVNGMLRDVASGITSISSAVSSIIAPAMIGLVIVVTLLVIVVKIAKKPRSAS